MKLYRSLSDNTLTPQARRLYTSLYGKASLRNRIRVFLDRLYDAL